MEQRLYKFYREVLESLDYSVTGYFDSKQQVDKLIAALYDNQQVRSEWQLKFLSYDMARLVDLIEFRTEPLTSDRIFYHSFKQNSDEPLFMHDYFLFKDWLRKFIDDRCATCCSGTDGPCVPKDGEGSGAADPDSGTELVRTASIVSQLFINATSFRVTCDSGHSVVVEFDDHTDCIAVNIPFTYIFKCKDGKLEPLHTAIRTAY